MSKTSCRTVQAEESSHKRKTRGVIRERSWSNKDGETTVVWVADFGEVNGKRIRKLHQTKEAAERWLREQSIQLANQGHHAFQATPAQHLDAERARAALNGVDGLPELSMLEDCAKTYAAAWKRLQGTGSTITDAVDYLLKHRPATGERRTVSEIVEEYTKDAEDRNLRPRSVKDIRLRMKPFDAKHGQRLVTEITRQDADNFLRGMELSPLSKRHYRTVIGGLFNFAIEREYVSENPFAFKTKRRRHVLEDERMPECLGWRDVAKVLNAAQEHDKSMVAPLAIGFFCGLRTSELCQLDWRDINLQAHRLTVRPETAKKRRTRHVDLSDNLLQWITPLRKESGLVAPPPGAWRGRFDAVRELAGLARWPHNAMRHSYASHHLAHYGDPAKTAFQLGHHGDPTMLFEHYRSLTTSEDAAAYWQIAPATGSNAIAFTAATA